MVAPHEVEDHDVDAPQEEEQHQGGGYGAQGGVQDQLHLRHDELGLGLCLTFALPANKSIMLIRFGFDPLSVSFKGFLFNFSNILRDG